MKNNCSPQGVGAGLGIGVGSQSAGATGMGAEHGHVTGMRTGLPLLKLNEPFEPPLDG